MISETKHLDEDIFFIISLQIQWHKQDTASGADHKQEIITLISHNWTYSVPLFS